MLTDSCAHHNFPEPILLGRKRWWGITCLQAAAEAAGSAERAAPPPVHTAGSPQIRLGRAAGRGLPSLPGKAPHGGPCSAHPPWVSPAGHPGLPGMGTRGEVRDCRLCWPGSGPTAPAVCAPTCSQAAERQQFPNFPHLIKLKLHSLTFDIFNDLS